MTEIYLTPVQKRVVGYLAAADRASASAVAAFLWGRSRSRGSAALILERLEAKGIACRWTTVWRLTEAGRTRAAVL